MANYFTFAVGEVLLLVLTICSLAAIFPRLSCLPRDSAASPTASPRPGRGGCLENPKYYSYIAVLALMATTMLVQVSHMVKLTLMLPITTATGIVNIYSWRDIFDRYDRERFQEYR